MAAIALPERMNLPPLAPLAGVALRRSLLDLLAEIEAIPEANRSDGKSLELLVVLREFERGLLLHPNPEDMHNLYVPRLHIVLRDPKFVFAPLENARLGSDGFTYEQRCLDLYRMIVPGAYRERSPMRPDDLAPFHTVAHPVVPLVLRWMDRRELPRINPDVVEALYLQVLRRVQEVQALEVAAVERDPILPELVAGQAELDRRLGEFEEADALAFEEGVGLEMDFVREGDLFVDEEAQLAEIREARRALDLQFEAHAEEAGAMRARLQQDLDRVEQERRRGEDRDRQRMEGLVQLQAEEAAEQARLFAVHRAELEAAMAAGIGPLELQIADLIDQGIADRRREGEAIRMLQDGVEAVGNQQRVIAANAQAIVAGQLALAQQIAVVNELHGEVKEGIRRADAYIQAQIDQAKNDNRFSPLHVIGAVVSVVGAILIAPSHPYTAFTLGAGALSTLQ